MTWRGKILLLVSAVALIAVPGCGGGDSDAPTKAAFVKQAEKICETAKDKEIKAFAVSMNKSQQRNLTGEAQARFVVNGAFQPIDGMVEELREIGAPDGDEEQVEEILEAFEGVVEEGRESPTSVFSSSAPYRSANKLAAAYGLKACSEF